MRGPGAVDKPSAQDDNVVITKHDPDAPQDPPPPLAVIETLEDLERLADHLRGVSRVGIDLESDSFYVYHEKVCLLQLSTPDDDFVIDPLAVRDLSPLGPMFRDPSIEKIFHAGEYDIVCIKRDYGFEVANVFDTMIASRILGAKELGLAALIHRHFGVALSKKLQRSDWGKRPLTIAQLEYARMDTHFLLRLRDLLTAELDAKGLLHDADEEFARLVCVLPPKRIFDPDAFWRLPGARALTGGGRAVLKELYYFREKTAATIDKAAFRVLPEALMVRLAEVPPKSMAALESTKGMTPYLLTRFGRDLLAAIERGLAAEPIEREPDRPERKRWDSTTLHRYEALRQWRKKKAEERDVDTVVVLATEDLRALAEAPAAGGGPETWLSTLSDRKRDLYGAELAALLETPPPKTGLGRRRGRRGRGGRGAAAA